MSKLLEFQRKVGTIKKDSTNPYYRSKYADINSLLETIKPVLNELGINIIQPLEVKDGKTILATKVFEDGKIIAESSIIIPENPDPQKIGSAITYYRRYSLQSLLLLEAEDDDAEKAKVSQGIKMNKKIIPLKTKEADKKNDNLDLVIIKKITECMTEKELKDLYTALSDEEKPLYLEKLSNRKSILKAAK